MKRTIISNMGQRDRIYTLLMAMTTALTLLLSGNLAQPLFAEDGAARPLFLPFVQNKTSDEPDGKPTATVTPGPTEQPTGQPTAQPTEEPTKPAPVALGNGFFVDTQWRTSSASLETDTKGGNHLAFLYYHGLAENVPNSGAYFFCASGCDKPANWQGVRLGEEVNEIQLALTPQGNPRVLYRTRDTNNGWRFFYGACDGQCTEPSNWTLTHVASNQGMAPLEINDDELPQRTFALDPAGRPRLVYNDRAPQHFGTFYTFCDEACNDANNWQEVRINKDNGGVGPYRDEDLFYPALTFTPAGQPRVLADGVTMQDEFFLLYVACDTGCDQAANWQSAPLFPRGSGFEFSYDIAITADGKPRIAYYEGAHVNGGGNVLWYGWCHDNCTNSGNWERHQLGLPVLEGQEPDLELDSAGRPHIAYALYKDGGLGYSVCSSACESSGAQWKHQVVETRTQMAQTFSAALPTHCSSGIWNVLTPSLALDGSDKPHVAFDATYHGKCHYVGEDKWEPWNEMNLVWRAVRVRLTGSGAAAGGPTVTPTVTPSVTPSVTPGTPTPTVTPSVTPTSEPLPRLGYGKFMETQWQTSSSDAAVDGDNGIHMAYVHTEVFFPPDPDGDSNPTSAVYRYCATACEKDQNWISVELGTDVSEVQIGVTAGGLPRLLLLERAFENGMKMDRYVYAECNQKCANSGNWQLLPVITVPNELSWHWLRDPQDMSGYSREEERRSYFALDPFGRPRFVYTHDNDSFDGSAPGGYYAACDANCTDISNWWHTRFTQLRDNLGLIEWDHVEEPILTFAPDGSPRILAAITPAGVLSFTNLYYVACDFDCHLEENWQMAWLGNGDDVNGDWDMAIDPFGRPYVVITSWWKDGLRYGWCDIDCTNPDNWQVVDGPLLDIDNPDLEFSADGEPRIIYETWVFDQTGNNGQNILFHLKCISGCRSFESEWQYKGIESSQNIAAEYPATIPAACDDGRWTHLVPHYVLGNADTVFVAVDVTYFARCSYNEGSGAWQKHDDIIYNTVVRAARVVSFITP